ncbi:MAG: calcium/sodium antiporter [Corallococcus sp.]|nr:calcium/sodium antiporter [Corallococcus sp.]MCM1359007.1 calcium/sodium antiporter [Corallococcus sp.]MCM1394996.1 calcium/sodium antiporter [Corallococcus sp.]
MLTQLFSFIYGWPLWLQLATYVVGLALGVFCLVKFCNIFVDASGAIAKKMKISPLIIGLTIVAMGTSLPELAVSVSDSITALVNGSNAEMAIGNVVGSNVCNLLLVLGFSVVFTPILVKKNTLKHEFPILIGVSAIVVIFVFLFGTQSVTGEIAITRWEGGILVAGIVAYIVYLVFSAKRHPEEIEVEENEIKDMAWWKAILLTVLGAVGIFVGGQFVEFGARGLAMEGATAMGLDEDLATNLVGLTIVAVGTSLPELVTSTIAAKKGQNEIALGNVIGSNIFNSLFVLGISSVICPLKAGNQVYADVVVMIAVTLLVFAFALRGKLKRCHGITLLTIYGIYLAYLIMRTLKPEWFAWMM